MAVTTTSSSSCTNGFFSLRSTNSGSESKFRGCGKPDGVAMWFINGVTTAFFASLQHCCIRIATEEDGDDINDDLPLILNDGNLRRQEIIARRKKGKKT